MKVNFKVRVVIFFVQFYDVDILIDKFCKYKYMVKEKYVWVGLDVWVDF